MKKTPLCATVIIIALFVLAGTWAASAGIAENSAEPAVQTESQEPFEATEANYYFALGMMYYNGQGVPQDYKEAVSWYTKAAEQGHAKAQFSLGAMYTDGRGVPQDSKVAATNQSIIY